MVILPSDLLSVHRFPHDEREGRNRFYQQQLSNQIQIDMNELTSSLTEELNFHLNWNQSFVVNTPSVFFSLQKISIQYVLNQTIADVLDLRSNQSVSLEVRFLCRSLIFRITVEKFFRSKLNVYLSTAPMNGRAIPVFLAW